MGMGWLLFGGLGVLSMHGTRFAWHEAWAADWAGLGAGLHPLEQLRSAGMCAMFVVVLVVIAYFTNPNEASFRTFLTELTFRRHLTQLHVPALAPPARAPPPAPDPKPPPAKAIHASASSHKGTHSSKSFSADKAHSKALTLAPAPAPAPLRDAAPEPPTAPPGGFLFTNRAAVSFRTGPHTLRSFGLFSLGIVQPVLGPSMPGEPAPAPAPALALALPPGKPSARSPPSTSSSSSSLSHTTLSSAATLADESAALPEDLPGLWILGAFGTWWIGGPLVPMPQRKGRAKAERCKDVKGQNGASQQARIISVHKLDNVEPEGSAQDGDSASHALKLPSRPSTPPPLPKSAVLPLHAQQTPPLGAKSHDLSPSSARAAVPRTPSALDLAAPPTASSLQVPSSPPQSFAHEPAVLALLGEITGAESAVSEVQQQLEHARASGAEQQAALHASVEQQRERKRVEEAEKKELRTRTRALDEARRQAENARKEAEKKLRAVQAARDGAALRKGRLEREVRELRGAVEAHVARAAALEADAGRRAREEAEEVERKSREMGSKEAEVAALSSRAQGLEEKLRAAEDRLKRVREEEQRRLARARAEQVARAANAMFEQQMKDQQRVKQQAQAQQQQQQAHQHVHGHPHAHPGHGPAHQHQPPQPFRGAPPHVHTRPHVVHSHSAHAHAHHQPSLFERRQMAQHSSLGQSQTASQNQSQNQSQGRNVSGPAATSPTDGAGDASAVPNGNRSRSLSLKGLRAPQHPQPGTGNGNGNGNTAQGALASATANALAQRAKGYAIFDQDIAAAGNGSTPPQQFGFGFASGDPLLRSHSLGDAGAGLQPRERTESLLSPAAASFLPSNLLNEHSPRLLPDDDEDDSPYFASPASPGDSQAGSGFDARRLSQPSELARSTAADADWRAVGSRRGSQHADASAQVKHVLDRMIEQATSIAVAGLSSFDRYNEQRATFSPPRPDSAPGSPGFMDFDGSGGDGGDGGSGKMDAVSAAGDAKRRWFSTKKPALNPDAKAFTPPSAFMASSTSLPQLSSRFMPWRGASQSGAALFADLPLSPSDGPSFFSSLRAFQPSADELKALGVGNPASRSRETINSFGSSGGAAGAGGGAGAGMMVDLPSPSSIYAPGLPHIPPFSSRPVSGNASQVSLDKSLASTAAAVAAAWEADTAASSGTGGVGGAAASNKRPFGRWWSRSKEAVNTDDDKPAPAASLGPIERPVKAIKSPVDVEE